MPYYPETQSKEAPPAHPRKQVTVTIDSCSKCPFIKITEFGNGSNPRWDCNHPKHAKVGGNKFCIAGDIRWIDRPEIPEWCPLT